MKYKVVRVTYTKEEDVSKTIEVEADYFQVERGGLVFYNMDEDGETIPVRAFSDWDEVS